MFRRTVRRVRLADPKAGLDIPDPQTGPRGIALIAWVTPVLQLSRWDCVTSIAPRLKGKTP